jgi:Delta-aminolevulinic acid dehydratase
MMRIIGKYPDIRLRRVRNSDWVRRLVSENNLSANDLILPIFVTEGKNKIQKIKSMEGVYRYSVDKLDQIVNQAVKFRIPMIAIFPHTDNKKKDSKGTEALNENNLVCKSIIKIKNKFKNIGVMCEGALDPYTSHGHDFIGKKNKFSTRNNEI